MGVLQSRPSVPLSRYLLLNHWTKSNQIWCVCCSHEWGVQQHFFFPTPWGPGEGPKDKILLNIIKFQLQSQFQRFLNQTLCVYSQMKDIKHTRQYFHSAAWVMPKGRDLGLGGQKKISPKFNQTWCVSYLYEWLMQWHNFLGPPPPGVLGRGQTVKYH